MSKYAREMELAVEAGLSAWIAPDGTFHAVPECGHERYCREHIFGLQPNSYDFWQHDGASKLESQGWLHISGGHVYRKASVTQSQVDILFDFACIVEKRGYRPYGFKALQEGLHNLIELMS